MKDNFWLAVFSVLVFLVFIFEGFGLPFGREFSFYTVLIMPLFLLLPDLIFGKAIYLPRLAVIILLSYLVIVTFAAQSGISPQNSFKGVLYLFSLSLVFISVFNHKNLALVIPGIILRLCYCFIGYSIFLYFFAVNNLQNVIPGNGYQFVFSNFGSHNHLGDFLVLGIMVSLYELIFSGRKKYVLPVLLFSFFVFISFSRSAYVALMISVSILIISGLMRKKIKLSSITVFYGIILVAVSMFLFFSVVTDIRSVPILKDVNSVLTKQLDLKDKTFVSRRDEFAKFAINSFLLRPFWGVGSGNFLYIAQENSPNTYKFKPHSSHNLFLDLLSENGIFALVLFLVFLIVVFYSNRGEPSLPFFLLLGMLVNFQTDYTHTIYSFFLLFFILLALIHKERTIYSRFISPALGIFSVLVLVMALFLI